MQPSVAEVELDRLAVLCASLRLHCSSDDDIAGHLLEPIANALGAEAAACRHLRLQHTRPQIEKLVSIGVAASVADDYLSHFHHLDPFLARLRALPAARPAPHEPADTWQQPDPADTLYASLAPAAAAGIPAAGNALRRYYHEFLYPNGLVHHTGFAIRNARQQRLWIFNFHRPAAAQAFSSLEHTRSRVIEACLQGQAASAAQADTPAPRADALALLTSRERDVVTAVAQGYANKQIAAVLCISPRTVENHLRSVYDKLQINTRTQLLSLLHWQDYNPAGTVIE